MTDVPALTKQLEAGQGCSAAAPLWTAEDRHALLNQIVRQNNADRLLDPRVPALTISQTDGAVEIDITDGVRKRKLLQLGTTQQSPICDGGVLDKNFATLEVKDPTVPDVHMAFDSTIRDSPFKRGDIGAGTEQFNTPAQRQVFRKLPKDASNDDKVDAAESYLKRTMPHASEAELSRALDRFMSPPISKQMPFGISEIVSGSPAEKAGLQVGDVVKTVNGVDLNGKQFAEAAPMITGAPGTTVNIVLERNEHGKLVELTRQMVRVDFNPSTMLDVNAANFHEEVENSKIPVFIDVKADWCIPCRTMAPMLEELKQEYAGRVKFVRIDTDNSKGLIQTADSDNGPVLPTLAFYNPVTKQTPAVMGIRDKEALKKFIDKQLADPSAR